MTTNSIGTARRMVLVLAALAIAACDAANDIVDELDDIGNTAEVHYYLSLGDSLSVGVQPNGSAVLLPTNEGYTDQLYDSIRPGFEAGGNLELRHTKLGCPGEDIDKMVNGGSCVYLAGSQLDAAVDFLRDNGDRVHLVTIDMGGNDFRNEDCVDETMVDLTCANTISAQIYTDFTAVLTALQNAADPSTTIVGMNYYNPYLATWLLGDAGQVVAVQAAEAVSVFNGFLSSAYMDAGIPMADVALAFESDEFAVMVMSSQPPPNEMLPVSVNNICEMTYMCDLVRGPDIHANDAGYSLIAATIEAAIP